MSHRALVLTSFVLLAALSMEAGEVMILAEDDASDPAYKAGWSGGGSVLGFRDWTFKTLKAASGNSSAGFFIVEKGRNPDLNGIAIRDKAFGLYANGTGFEAAVAFRPLKKPLAVGQTLSFLIEHGTIGRKFDKDDPGGGAIGVTLRSGNEAGGIGDYNKRTRFEFGCFEGQGTYRVYDGSPDRDTRIALTDGGLSVSVTLVTIDTYDLEVTTLADRKTNTFTGRRLGGESGGAIESFCIFNRDGEKSDAFFNGFQISGESR
jgi:hypothetical protein